MESSAKEMFEEIGYECYDLKRLGAKMFYKETHLKVRAIIFLVDKKKITYGGNILRLTKKEKLAIKKQAEEFGWIKEEKS